MQVRLLTETLNSQSLLGCGTWPQLMCCDLVAVWVPEVGRGQVGVSEQGGSSDDDQDSEWRGGNGLKASGAGRFVPNGQEDARYDEKDIKVDRSQSKLT